jgi:hypothetical protein
MTSEVAAVDGEADANTTDSGPYLSLISDSRSATVCSASSQLIGNQPGSLSPFGVDQLRRHLALYAKGFAGRMTRIRRKMDKLPVFNSGN